MVLRKEGHSISRFKNVVVIGGTGFIGYNAVKEFIRSGYNVTVLALPPMPKEDLFSKEVMIRLADLNSCTDAELISLLNGQDALVYAAGVDDRVIPKKPAYDFFYAANVKPCIRLFSLARKAGVKRAVLLSSYFCYFDRIWPEKKLSLHHPYIRSRQEQAKRSIDAAGPALDLMILELPYIFGAIPGRTPLWKPLIQYVNSSLPLFYTKGGTNVIAVEDVAKAIVGAIEYGKAGGRYVIGDKNLTWKELLQKFSVILGKNQKVKTIPTFLVRMIMNIIKIKSKLLNKESGLDPVKYVDIQTVNTFFDPRPAKEILRFGEDDLNQALKETVSACLKN